MTHGAHEVSVPSSLFVLFLSLLFSEESAPQ